MWSWESSYRSLIGVPMVLWKTPLLGVGVVSCLCPCGSQWLCWVGSSPLLWSYSRCGFDLHGYMSGCVFGWFCLLSLDVLEQVRVEADVVMVLVLCLVLV